MDFREFVLYSCKHIGAIVYCVTFMMFRVVVFGG